MSDKLADARARFTIGSIWRVFYSGEVGRVQLIFQRPGEDAVRAHLLILPEFNEENEAA